MKVFSLLFSILFLPVSLISALTPEEAVELMRSHIGNEQTITEVETLRYTGTITFSDGQVNNFIVAFKKPYLQLVEIHNEEVSLRRSIDGFQGFIQQKNKETGKSVQSIMLGEMYESMKIEAIENLFFFKGSPFFPMEVSILNPSTEYEGKNAAIVKFQHPLGFFYERTIDRKTGNILSSTNQLGIRLVEQGEKKVKGLRLPASLLSYNEKGELTKTFSFDTIEVNPDLDESYFSYKAL